MNGSPRSAWVCSGRPLRLLAIGLLGTLSTLVFAPPSRVAAAGWMYTKAITIDHTKIGGSADLSSFPVLISFTATDLKSASNGGLVQNISGYDMIFRDSTKTVQLDHEIDWYVPTTGSIAMWVRIPTLSVSVDTTIYLYYDNSSITTSQETPTGVWDSSYKAVWHLGQSPPTPPHDSTNAHNGTLAGPWGASQQVPGEIGGSLNFNAASSTSVTSSDIPAMDNSSYFTLEGWFNFTTNATDWQGQVYASADAAHRYILESGGVGDCNGTASRTQWEADLGNGSDVTACTPSVIVTGAWQHVALVFDGTQVTNAAKVKIYVNGVAQTMTFDASAMPTKTAAVAQSPILGYSTGSGNYYNGLADEIRVSSSARSAGWIATEYNNDFSPTTFIGVGAETPIPAGSLTISLGNPVTSFGAFVVGQTSPPVAAGTIIESNTLADGATWSTTVTASDLTSGANSIPASAMAMNLTASSFACGGAGCSNVAGAAAPATNSAFVNSTSGQTVMTGTAAAQGQFVQSGVTFTLTVPWTATARGSPYTGTLTYTITG